MMRKKQIGLEAMARIQDQSPRLRLNQLFVEWLMGLPIGWTVCEPLATESFRSWRHTHTELLRRF
jgi:hypothetical protein